MNNVDNNGFTNNFTSIKEGIIDFAKTSPFRQNFVNFFAVKLAEQAADMVFESTRNGAQWIDVKRNLAFFESLAKTHDSLNKNAKCQDTLFDFDMNINAYCGALSEMSYVQGATDILQMMEEFNHDFYKKMPAPREGASTSQRTKSSLAFMLSREGGFYNESR